MTSNKTADTAEKNAFKSRSVVGGLAALGVEVGNRLAGLNCCFLKWTGTRVGRPRPVRDANIAWRLDNYYYSHPCWINIISLAGHTFRSTVTHSDSFFYGISLPAEENLEFWGIFWSFFE
jgi:hypothetical protein